jgi:hypothetical protein
MNSLEDNLRDALRRQEPSDGFAERVLSKIPERKEGWKPSLTSLFRMPILRWAAVGSLVICLLFAGWVWQERERRIRAEGEMAKAQLMQALRIASLKLNGARKKIHDSGRHTTQLQVPAEEDGFRVQG